MFSLCFNWLLLSSIFLLNSLVSNLGSSRFNFTRGRVTCVQSFLPYICNAVFTFPSIFNVFSFVLNFTYMAIDLLLFCEQPFPAEDHLIPVF